jgi:hypothetical protein
MKAVKIVGVLLVLYVGIVAAFESALGYSQPTREGGTIVITTVDPDGTRHDRVVSRVDSGGQLYVAANHWPRAWYRRALANPEVQVKIDGQSGDYTAVPLSDEEDARVRGDKPLPLVFRILTGFPPRYFLRLDPRPAAAAEPEPAPS